MLPEGSVIQVKGSNKQTVYFASHAMQTFTVDVVTVFGRVLDENGLPINDLSNQALTVTQEYGEDCFVQNQLSLINGFFKTPAKRFSDNRSFFMSLDVNSANYLQLS